MKNLSNLSTKWKKRLVCAAVFMGVLSILATGTAAHFVAEETAYNVITTGCLYMDLVEETTNEKPWPEEGVKDVYPGMTVDKIVTVRNRGSVPFFCKVSLDGKVTAYEGGELPFEHITLDLNREQWIEKNGAYYYYRILQPGEETEPLFTTVSFEPEMGNEYMRAKVNIYVLAQAVQSDNNGEDPLEALGWSEAAKTVIEQVEALKTQAIKPAEEE